MKSSEKSERQLEIDKLFKGRTQINYLVRNEKNEKKTINLLISFCLL